MLNKLLILKRQENKQLGKKKRLINKEAAAVCIIKTINPSIKVTGSGRLR